MNRHDNTGEGNNARVGTFRDANVVARRRPFNDHGDTADPVVGGH